MNLFELDHLFRKHGLIMVWDPSAYHGFLPEDIDGDRICEGACPIASIGSLTYVSLSKERGEEFIQICKRVKNHYPYHADYPYIVAPLLQQIGISRRRTAWRI